MTNAATYALTLCALLSILSPADAAALGLPQDATTHAADVDPWHAPDLYDDETEGISEPVSVKEVNPNYTHEALQRRIQGIVLLECIIEKDGTVGPIRIRHSLDAVYGLDAEAIKAVRQWRFRPAVLDGVPVKRLASVELSFDVGTKLVPKIEWPRDFPRSTQRESDVRNHFNEVPLATEKLRMKIRYPHDWEVTQNVPGYFIVVRNTSADDPRVCAMAAPQPTAADRLVPESNDELDTLARNARKQAAKDPAGIEVLHVGQLATDRIWLWVEMSRRSLVLSALRSETAATLPSAVDGMRVWTFATSDSGQQITLSCYTFQPRGLSKSDLEVRRRQAGAEFASILATLSIRPR